MNKLVIMCLISLIITIRYKEAYAGTTIEKLRQAVSSIRKVCLPVSKADPDVVDAAVKGEFPTDDKSFNCYVKCTMGMMQFLKNGTFSAESGISMARKMVPTEILDRCIATIQKCETAWDGFEDPCDAAYAVIVCMYKADPELAEILF